MGSLNQLKSSAAGTHLPMKGAGQITTLTRRSACGVAQLSEANCGGLGTEDGIDVLEESATHNPVGVTSTLTNTRTGIQIEDSSGTDSCTGADPSEIHILRIDRPCFSTEREGKINRGIAS